MEGASQLKKKKQTTCIFFKNQNFVKIITKFEIAKCNESILEKRSISVLYSKLDNFIQL